MNAAEQIAGGDVAVQVATRSARDTLGIAFGEMVRSQRAIAAAAERIAGGDLTVQIAPRSERDVLGVAFAEMVRRLSHTIAEVRAGASALSAASARVSATANSLSQGTSEQAGSVEETSASGGSNRDSPWWRWAPTESTSVVRDRMPEANASSLRRALLHLVQVPVWWRHASMGRRRRISVLAIRESAYRGNTRPAS
jgi:hypothetical protein